MYTGLDLDEPSNPKKRTRTFDYRSATLSLLFFRAITRGTEINTRNASSKLSVVRTILKNAVSYRNRFSRSPAGLGVAARAVITVVHVCVPEQPLQTGRLTVREFFS